MNTDVPFIKIDIVEESEKFSEAILNKRNDLILLLDRAIKENKEEVFSELAFTGKYLNGLTKVFNKGQNIPEVESLVHVKKDLADNFNVFKEKLKELISREGEQILKKYEVEYFSLNHQSFNNLRMLAEDFDKVKVYLNHLKHKTK